MKVKFLRKILAMVLVAMIVLALFSIMGFKPIGPLVEGGPVEIDPVMLTAAVFASFLLEIGKYLIRTVVLNQPGFDFPPIFYEAGVPFVVFLTQILFGKVGWGVMPEFTVNYLVNWFLGVVVAIGGYYISVKPLKAYRKRYSKA